MKQNVKIDVEVIERLLSGEVMPVSSRKETQQMLSQALREMGYKETDIMAKAIYSEAMRYNSNKTEVSHIAFNATEFGYLFALVRDESMQKLDDPNGVLAYVYNVTYTDCSELGYIFIAEEDGIMRRIS